MKPVFYNSSEKCSQLVNHYIFIGSDHDNLLDRFVSDGSISIVFNFLGNVKLLIDNSVIQLSKYFIVTPSISSIKLNTIPPFDTMVVHCNATVFSNLFNINMEKYSKGPYKEIELPFGDLLWNKLKDNKKTGERVRIIEEYLLENILPDKYEPDKIDIIYKEIISAGCPKSVHEILEKYEANPRSFRRNFIKRLGISAKSIARIVRVNYIWDKIKNSPEADIYNIIYDCKFFDQAHFINDFKKIIGETPQTFFHRDLRQVEVLSGKNPANP